jgi:hypothetical protein
MYFYQILTVLADFWPNPFRKPTGLQVLGMVCSHSTWGLPVLITMGSVCQRPTNTQGVSQSNREPKGESDGFRAEVLVSQASEDEWREEGLETKH